MAIAQLIQRLITQETRSTEEERHDLDILLNHISNLRKISQVLVKQFKQEQQRGERQTQFVMELSRQLQESTSILLGSAWMLDVHGDYLKPETRRKHYCTILDSMFELSRQLNLVPHWQEQLFDLKPIQHELEKLGVRTVERQRLNSKAHIENLAARQAPSPKLNLEPDVLKMILDEVLDNAMKFSSGRKVIECQVIRTHQQIQISVRDQGCGIPESEKLKVFRSFYRAYNVGGVKGYGLGLAIVRKLVSDYGGTLLLKSQLGKGTEIMISFPLNEADLRSPDLSPTFPAKNLCSS